MKYNSFVITLLVIFVLFVSKSKAESIRDAFKRLANKKSNGGSMPGDVKGTVCKHTGHKVSNHKSTLCWNKHGPRCDSGFLKETECYYQQTNGDRCCTWSNGRPGMRTCVPNKLKSNKELSEHQCPFPCGCIFSDKPKRESSSVHKVQKLKVKGGGCYSRENWNQVRKYLQSWKVPQAAYSEFEMGTLMDRNDFLAFDLYIQPSKNKARYGLAFGATRCHGDTIEFGYMFTGMWEVETQAQKRCSSAGGGRNKDSCSKSGIADEDVNKARKTLEWYAWDYMKRENRFDVQQLHMDNGYNNYKNILNNNHNIFSNYLNDEEEEDEEEDDGTFWPKIRKHYTRTKSWIKNDFGMNGYDENDELGWNADKAGGEWTFDTTTDDSSLCSTERYAKGLLNRPNGIRRGANPFSHDNSGYHVYVDEKKCTQKVFDGCCSICTGPTLYDYCWAKCASKPENHDYSACSLRPNN